MSRNTRVNIGLTSDLKEYLQAQAKDMGLSMSALIVVYINQAIDQRRAIDSMSDIKSVLDRLEEVAEKQDA